MFDKAPVDVTEFNPVDIAAWLESGDVMLVDVRETSEYEAEHIAGALLLPLSALDADVFPALPSARIVVHCAIGKRSAAAARILIAAGHDHVAHMAGGLKAWKAAGLETELPLDVPEQPAAARPPAAHPGQVLTQEYLTPQALSPDKLSTALGVAPARIDSVLNGEAAVDSELSLRLARFFSTEPDFWMQLQLAYDLDRVRACHSDRINSEVAPRAA